MYKFSLQETQNLQEVLHNTIVPKGIHPKSPGTWSCCVELNVGTDAQLATYNTYTFSEGMKHCPFGFADLVANRATSMFSAIPALAVHFAASKISLLILCVTSSGLSCKHSVISKNDSSQLKA
jgi:hypothetical protein